MKKLTITSKNSSFQIFTALKRNRSKRKKYAKILVEGVLPITLCMRSQCVIEAIIVERGKTLSQWAHDIIDQIDCPSLYIVEKNLMSELSEKDETSELMLVVEYPQTGITELNLEDLKQILVIDRPSNPGNLGAIIRTCDAFHINVVFLTGHSVDPYDPKTITASRGTIFTVPVVSIESNVQLNDLISELKKMYNHFTVYGSSGTYGTNIQDMRLAQDFCLIIGNETYGMNDFLKTLSDDVIRIGMHGSASSLNVACATSIMLYELTRTVQHPAS